MKKLALLGVVVGLLGVACYATTGPVPPCDNIMLGCGPGDLPPMKSAKKCGADAGTCDGGVDAK